MEVIVQEGQMGAIFDNVTLWEIEKLEVTGTFVVKIYNNEHLIGQTPFNPKSTVIIINHFDTFDDMPGANTK